MAEVIPREGAGCPDLWSMSSRAHPTTSRLFVNSSEYLISELRPNYMGSHHNDSVWPSTPLGPAHWHRACTGLPSAKLMPVPAPFHSPDSSDEEERVHIALCDYDFYSKEPREGNLAPNLQTQSPYAQLSPGRHDKKDTRPITCHVGVFLSRDDTSATPRPTQQVDYLSHDWEEGDIWSSWRHLKSQRKVDPNFARLENALWRTWTKHKDLLWTITPEKLNWSAIILDDV